MAEARKCWLLPDKVLQEKIHHIPTRFAAMVSCLKLPPGRMAIKLRGVWRREKIATVVRPQ